MRSLTHAVKIHAGTCQVSWTRVLTSVSSTPSTLTLLISVPPNVAVVQQGIDPNLANQLMAAQQQALQSEANVRHSEVMERQRNGACE